MTASSAQLALRNRTPARRWRSCRILAPVLALVFCGETDTGFSQNPARNNPLGLGFSNAISSEPPEMTIKHRQRPLRPRLPRATMTVCIAAIVALGAERASAQAQTCFLFFCPPGAQPGWQGTPEPDRQGEPNRSFL